MIPAAPLQGETLHTGKGEGGEYGEGAPLSGNAAIPSV